MNIGNRLQQLRKKKGFTADQLAEKVNVTRIYITKLEHNDNFPSFPLLEKICDVLDITLSEFFNMDNSNISPELHSLLNNAKHLTPEQINLLNKFIDTMKKN